MRSTSPAMQYFASGKTEVTANVVSNSTLTPCTLYLESLTEEDRQILLDGCLINYYKR